MKNLKVMFLAIAIMMFSSAFSVANAQGIGFINYKKVQDNYNYAKDAMKEVDAKGLELQQYLVDKEKEFKTIETPVQKKNFEEKTAKEFKAKQDSYLDYKTKKESDVFDKIQLAAKQVMIEQKLDTIIDYRVIFVGGIDVTDLVLQKLNK
ncbi:OmpH family outer membrane protein [bacterium]|nr:OmpH family outer membrane protein [bacterium]